MGCIIKYLYGTIFLLSCLNGTEACGQWTSLNTGTIEYLFNVNFPSPDTGYVVQSSGSIRKSVNSGQSWVFQNANTLVYDIAFTSVQTGFGIDVNTIYQTLDGGITWDTVYNEPDIYFYKIYNDGPDFIYAIGGDFGGDSAIVITSYDHGLNWTRRAFQEGFWGVLSGGSFLNPALGYVTDGISLFKTLDSGQTWLNICDFTGNAVNTIHFTSPDTGYALATILLRTTNGGLNWTQVNTNGNNTAFYDMKFINNSVGYLVGGNGFNSGPILKTIDSGINWDLDTSSVQTFMALYFANNSMLYASGTGGALWKLDVLSGVNENVENRGKVTLNHDFNEKNFILEGTTAGGEILVYDSYGKMIQLIIPESNRTFIHNEKFAPGIYLIHYIHNKSNLSFRGIKF